MSKNIFQVYQVNPITTNQSADLMYFGRSPYGLGDDTAMQFSDFAAQFGAVYTPSALTRVNDTNVTLTLGGTPSTALLQATSLTLGWTGQLSVPRGGTGIASATAYSLLAGGTTSTGSFQSLASGTLGQVLKSNGNASLPTWVDLSTLGVSSITGTANQVLANGTVATPQAGAVTLTLPQDIATTSSPHFNNIQLDGGLIYDANGNVGVQITAAPSAVNYLNFGNSAAGAPGTQVYLEAKGSDTNIAIAYVAKGAQSHNFYNERTAGQLIFITGPAYNRHSQFNFPSSAGTSVYTYPNATGTFALTSDIPTGAALTRTDDTNVTLTLGGSPATALVNAASLTLGWTGTLAVGRGGLGISTTPSNGQIPIGNGTNYTAATITAGAGVSVTNGAGSITIASTGVGSLVWNDVSGTSQSAAVNNGYIISNASQTTVTIPATAAVGSVFAVQGKGAAGWILQMNTGQICHFGNSATASAGSLTSTNQWDSVTIVCVTANTTFAVTSAIGNLTVA